MSICRELKKNTNQNKNGSGRFSSDRFQSYDIERKRPTQSVTMTTRCLGFDRTMLLENSCTQLPLALAPKGSAWKKDGKVVVLEQSGKGRRCGWGRDNVGCKNWEWRRGGGRGERESWSWTNWSQKISLIPRVLMEKVDGVRINHDGKRLCH